MNAGPATGRPSTKERIVTAGAELFRRQGYTGTGLKQIVAAADAPFGSVYHFFPGGKEQLGAEVVRTSGAAYGRLFTAAMEAAPDPVTGVRDFFAGAARTLVETGYADACPIATLALEVASTNEPLRQATAEVFTGWITLGTAAFAAAGIGARPARELTIVLLAALEGAFVLARALRSTEPLEAAGESVAARASALLGSPDAGRG
ncbi:TetR/AcrR family transcriptional regulator [Nonomuraea roseoviolacea]|uniref:AcrR family transcriptional regulator n=1 Tax=Nonomuraea roseoviolacea subsp. carminata TaxID=160689 RepID=A0ABT1K4K6_9ACTN|nr:TetR/AcrR family transcriptional regulator [Nonomuraea roseoviolacea]MCP2348938.1 AcrR family transcriptional regulator [Nonomuraea roseoviolacea subsp. carminata]